MHPYLQKLLNQGWVSYHKFQFLERDLWTKRLRSNKQDTKEVRYKKQRSNLENQIIKLTSFMPIETKLPVRMRFLRSGFTDKEIICEVPNCYELKKKSAGEKGKFFYRTCGLKDKEHLEYRSEIDTIARTQVWDGRDQDERDLIQSRKEKTFVENYGIANPKQAHYNLENLEKLTKKYFEDNFLTEEGYVKDKEFREFLNSTSLRAFEFAKNLEVNYTPRPNGGFNPTLPGILYYIKDITTDLYKIGITNFSVRERYGPKFKEIVVIKTWVFEDGSDAHELEQFLHSELSTFRLLNENFEGYGPTEFFSRDILGLDSSE